MEVGPVLAEAAQRAVQQLSVATALTGGRDAEGIQAVSLTDSEESTSETGDEQDDPMTGDGDEPARGSQAEGSSSAQAGSAA